MRPDTDSISAAPTVPQRGACIANDRAEHRRPSIGVRAAAARRRRHDALLRLGGAVLLLAAAALAYLCTSSVRTGGHHAATLMEALLTLAIFAFTTAGLALLVLGIHLLDEVMISERWRPRE